MSDTREVSVICRHCGTLVGGVEAGNSVRRSGCTSETQQQAPDGSWVCAVPLEYPLAWPLVLARRLRAFFRFKVRS